MKSLLLAAIFLTRLPLRVEQPPELARAMPFFPVVGACIGAAVGLVYWLAHRWLPAWPAALLALGGGILLTGALHEDGLADCADGFGGGRDREDKLRIMRDSAIGSYGALALILSVGLRVSAIAGVEHAWKALIAAHCLSRAALPLAMHFLPPASHQGVAAAAGKPSPVEAGTALMIALLVAGLLSPVSIIPAAVTSLLFGWYAWRQLGGHSGDVLGGMEQLTEIAALLAALA